MSTTIYCRPLFYLVFFCTLQISAEAQLCRDTSNRFFLYRDSVTFYVNGPSLTKDNDLLITGQFYNSNTRKDGAFLIRADKYGHVITAKQYDSINPVKHAAYYYYKAIELADKSILLAGYSENLAADNKDLILTRTDPRGNMLWSRIYTSKLWTRGQGSADYFFIQQMKQDPVSGEIYFTSQHWAKGRNVTKVDPANGDIIWSNAYGTDVNFDAVFGLHIKQQELISFGTLENEIAIYRINKTTGDTIRTRFFQLADQTMNNKLRFVTPKAVTVLANGNYVIAGQLLGYYSYLPAPDYYPGGYVELDSNLNFVRAYYFRTKMSNITNLRVTVYPDGSGIFSTGNYISSYTTDVVFAQFRDGTILKKRLKRYSGEGLPFTNEFLRMPDGSDLQVQLVGDSANNLRNRIEFMTLNLTDTASECSGQDFSDIYMEPYQLVEYKRGLSSLIIGDMSPGGNKTLISQDFSLNIQSLCLQESYCDQLKLHPSKDTICQASTLQLKITKNKDCGAWPVFSAGNPVIQSATRINDSLTELRFKRSWTGYLKGTINGCNLLEDSVKITVLESPGQLELGADTVICPGNTIVLNARSGYLRYKWQDGSADSVFSVTQPGVYAVTVQDACGNTMNDTIIVKQASAPAFDLKPDKLTKCNDDSIKVTAPSGFISYNWFPAKGISSSSGQEVWLKPATSTTFMVIAEKTKGCFAIDSVEVTVNRSPAIRLGADTTLCSGQVLQLDAGAGFTSYVWSNGAISAGISVTSSGTYSIRATDANNCQSRDTITVSYAQRPVFSLGRDTTLCEKQQLILQPGISGSYEWQDQAKTTTYQINSTGLYWLQVNRGGCFFRDSISVVYHPLPLFSIPSDTILCNNSELVLNVTQAGNTASYTWENKNAQSVRTISQPGEYEVTVTDNGCSLSARTVVKYQQTPHITFSNAIALCKGETLVLNAGTQDAGYTWQDHSTGNSLKVSSGGTYSCTVTNACGSETKSVVVSEQVCICAPSVPNVFSPNGDGINDLFKPVVNCPISFYQLTIFDRDGMEIFRSYQSNNYWDGKYKSKPVPMGAYYYILRVKGSFDTEPKQQSGVVTVIR